jgi:hypothetical protein
MRQLSTTAAVVCALAIAAAADAQAGRERVWIDVNAGSEGSAAASFAMNASVDAYAEQADFGAHYTLPRRASFDVGGGFMLTPIVGVGVSVGGSEHEAQADLSARLPHPYFFNAFASAAGQTDIPMQRIERSLSVHAMFVPWQTKHLRLRGFVGPGYYRIQQDSVTDITYQQFYFIHSPTNVAELTDYEFERNDGSGWGFHAGADASVFFTRTIGVGAFAKYGRASIDLENTVATAFDRDERVSVKAGGLQVGGGVRLKF